MIAIKNIIDDTIVAIIASLFTFPFFLLCVIPTIPQINPANIKYGRGKDI